MNYDNYSRKELIEIIKCLSKNAYTFDLDDSGYLLLTYKNACLINSQIYTDSKYRNSVNKDDNNSEISIVKNNAFSKKYDDILKCVTAIDRANSTHLNVNDGRDKMTKRIMSIVDLKIRIEKSDPTLVTTLANYSDDRKGFSFATKFCHYVGWYALGNKNLYSIYDSIVSSILPYYAWKYLNINLWKKRTKNEVQSYSKNIKYEDYQKLIDDILKATGNKIDRFDLDHMLWYYYKGAIGLVKDSYGIINGN